MVFHTKRGTFFKDEDLCQGAARQSSFLKNEPTEGR